MSKSPSIFTDPWSDYELIDAGGGKKLERWGKIITIRPERQAYFHSGLPFADWSKMAHWEFEEISTSKGKWKALKPTPTEWTFHYAPFRFQLRITPFKHIGLFPEQRTNWDFITQNLRPEQRMLNLFAYTGAASLAAKKTGAEVVHVDSVRQLIQWSSENMEASGLDQIKWVCEDALKFAQRELKRNNTYDLIQMDPPAYGLGAKGEKWKLEQHIDSLIETAYGLLNPKGWLILNTYSPKVELAELKNKCLTIFAKEAEFSGQLWMESTSQKKLYFGDLIRIQKA